MENIKTILFDLDGTLLPMDRDGFEKAYIGSFAAFTNEFITPEQLGTALLSATHELVSNTEKTAVNEERFFKIFRGYLEQDAYDKLHAAMDAYYDEHFDVVKEMTKVSNAMVESVAYLKSKGYDIILATNPIFPRVATDKRIAWAGLDLEDFKDVTRFEENHFCKPQLAYYQEIIEDNQLDPETCLMVGNDVEEDLIAAQLGMKTMLLVDDLIHRNPDEAIVCDWQGTREAFLDKIKELF